MNRKIGKTGKIKDLLYGKTIKDYTTDSPNYGQGFDVPFYIGLMNIGANHDENQWRWSSTGRSLSKNTLGKRNAMHEQETVGYSILGEPELVFWKWKLISWAKGANEKKLRGECAFVNKDAELKEINCASKLTIICEEL